MLTHQVFYFVNYLIYGSIILCYFKVHKLSYSCHLFNCFPHVFYSPLIQSFLKFQLYIHYYFCYIITILIIVFNFYFFLLCGIILYCNFVNFFKYHVFKLFWINRICYWLLIFIFIRLILNWSSKQFACIS
jgi:hypothetical protein